MQRTTALAVAIAVFAVMAAAIAGAAWAGQEAGGDRLFQVSTIDALMLGDFDGSMTIADLERGGDTGLGTFDRLDGEMIMLDGTAWQARVDGSVSAAASSGTTPFASVARLRADRTGVLGPAANLSGTEDRLDAFLSSNPDLFAMARVDGTFPYVRVRSEPAQAKPYPNLTTALAEQKVYELRDVTGTVVALYSPSFSDGISVPGWHLHFVSGDRRSGGHVLDIAADGAAQVAIDDLPSFTVVLPPWPAPTGAATQTVSPDLVAVEKGG
jgi:acetolactate decarboxylase